MDNFLIEDDDIKIKKFEKSYFKYFKNFSPYDDIIFVFWLNRRLKIGKRE